MTAKNKKRNGKWIWTSDWTQEDSRSPRLVWFYTEIEGKGGKAAGTDGIRITADCRYKLYIDGEPVQYGPAKGDHQIHYVDTVNPGVFPAAGMHSVAIAVLHYPEDPNVGNHSMFSSDTPGLYVEGVEILSETGEHGERIAQGWKSCVDRTVSFIREEERFAPLQIHELRKAYAGDQSRQANLQSALQSALQPVIVRREEEMPVYLRPENLAERPIPPMLLKEHSFSLPVGRVEPHSKETFVLDAGEEMCAFPKLRVSGGKGARIRLLYSECYEMENGKADRTDNINGHLQGYCDQFTIEKSGKGGDHLGIQASAEGETCLEPFWFRTFRFIEVTVETNEEALTLDSFTYLETGYPLEVRTEVTTSDQTLAPVWDISLRTLRRCMHETYVDCPYYEQLQYIMDTRSEMLYTYAVSGDDRLARKSIREFARAQRPDGLLNCSYPNKCVNVIPGFSIYYILMVHDHMMYFGDPEVVREALPVIRKILQYFDRNTIKKGALAGLVKKTGGVNGEGELWSFIDWAQEWMDTTGMPPAGLHGPITMESLLYIMGLQKAAELEEYAGDASLGENDRRMAALVQKAVRTFCMDVDGFITDGPVLSEDSDIDSNMEARTMCGIRSQHCQVFGVLTGTLNEEEAKRNLEKSMSEAGFARCSVAMNFYLFRALEQTGLYAYTERCWDIWRGMVENHCTTCVEAEFYARSECHAWGALALYELPSVVLGVRPAAPGYARIRVKPATGYMRSACGKVHTPVGDLEISWVKAEDGRVRVKISCGDEVRAKIVESGEFDYA